ncbi:asialoglycoprotein receptor 1-like [Aquarana catesbeiana]|uniref:asialoglycoprotein receptor 1-like n=1 Tax=Aquarana catesbeiana TaxID=8400 RepID=UPI003CC9DB3F
MSKTEDLEMESDAMMKNEPSDNGTPAPKNTQFWVVLILVIIVVFMFLILVFFTILQFIHYGNLTEEQALLKNSVRSLSSLLEDLEETVNNFILRQENATSQQETLSIEQIGLFSQLEDLDSTLKLGKTRTDKLSRNLTYLEWGIRPLSNDTQWISGSVGKLEEGIWKAHGLSTPLCETNWVHYGLSCYYKSRKAESWEDARKECKYNRSDLVVINGYDEMNFIHHFSGMELTWIGLAEYNRTWKWVDNTSYEITPMYWLYRRIYTSNSDTKGIGDCAFLVDGHSWHQTNCFHQFMYICENKRIFL